MRRPPRPRDQRMVDLRVLASTLGHGTVMFVATATVLLIAMRAGLPPPQRSALAFTSLIAGNLGLIMLYRDNGATARAARHPNAAFAIVACGALAMLAAVTWLSPVAVLFGFGAPPLRAWLASLAAPLLLAIAMKILGVARRPRAGR